MNIGGSRGVLSFVEVRTPDEVIGRALARKGLGSEVFKIGSSFGRWAEVDLTSVIEDHDPVETIVDTLSRLIEADESGLAEDICRDPHALYGVQGGSCVKPTC